MNERMENWSQTIAICFMLGIVAFTTNQCTNALGTDISVQQYDGFNNNCELQGGVVYKGMCIDTESLIEVEID